MSSFVSLARKYRPTRFEDVVGQETVARALQGAVAGGKLGHAFLFSGPKGVGKTTMARILARAINCTGERPPCGACELCRDIAAGSDLDVHEIDGASYNKVENVRELRDALQVRPSRARCRVVIIDEVHMLSGAAFNALLKILEEPPPAVKFIFATTEPHKLPATVISRTQRYDFRRIAPEAMATRLAQIAAAEGMEVAEGLCAELARCSDGSLRDTVVLLEQLWAFADARIEIADLERLAGIAGTPRLLALAEALAAGDLSALLGALAELLDGGANPGRLVSDLIALLRDVLLRRTGAAAQAGLGASGSERPRSRKESPRIHSAEPKGGACPPEHLRDEGVERLGRSFDEEALLYALAVLDHAGQRLRTSSQPRILIECALIKIARVKGRMDLGELAARLEAAPAAPAAEPPPRPRVMEPGPPPQSPRPELEAVRAAWPTFLQTLGTQRGMLASTLQRAEPLAVDERELRVVVPALSAFHRQQLESEGQQETLNRLLFGPGGARLRWRFEEARSAAAPALPDIRRHPTVAKAVEVFGATIEDVQRPQRST